MADSVKKVAYTYVTVPHRAGQGARVVWGVANEGVNLLGYTGFPAGKGHAQLDFAAANLTPIRRAAKKYGWRLSKPKKAFLIQGKDVPGAVYRHLRKLAMARINVVAANAVAAGKGRYGMVLWVRPKDFSRAAKTLGAR